MEIIFNPKIHKLANLVSSSLYAVGGYVRNFLIDGSPSYDVDLSGAICVDEILRCAEQVGLKVVAEYKRTGTVVLSDGEKRYEFTCFRREKYAKGGAHTPVSTEFTDDIVVDSLRRDFKCNAVYYDIKNKIIVDPLGGTIDIENRVLDTVTDAEEVFSHDGLRLMRLARFAGELNFSPTNAVKLGAKEFAENICDVSAERIYEELKRILVSDKKYPFSDPKGHYTGLKLLSETGVLDLIIPELTLGRGMEQRQDFHDHDVLEHSLRSVLYATPDIRLDALLHDVGKPYCKKTFGKYHGHAEYGEKLAEKILKRLKADNATIKRVKFLTAYHMLDLKSDMRESKLRRFIVENYSLIPQLLKLKQADYSACKDDMKKAPSVKRWEDLIAVMKKDGTPFCYADLNISSTQLMQMGFKGKEIGKILEKIFDMTVLNPLLNTEEKLATIAKDNIKL